MAVLAGVLTLYGFVTFGVFVAALTFRTDSCLSNDERRRYARTALLSWAWPVLGLIALSRPARELWRDAFGKELR